MAKLPPALDAALTYAGHGLKPFPLAARSKVPTKGSRGFEDATLDGGVLHRRFAAAGVDANVGIATGGGLVVLDLDSDVAEAWLAERAAAGDVLPRTWIASSGKGRHIYLHVDRPVKSTPLAKVAGFDEEGSRVKGEGGYVVAPPSVHPDGPVYAWLDRPKDVAPAPAWLMALLEAPHAPTRNDMSAGAPFPEGGRNSGLAAEAGRLRRRGLGAAAIEAELLDINRVRCSPPLDEDEVRTIARSVGRYLPDPVAVADERLEERIQAKGPIPTDAERRYTVRPPDDAHAAALDGDEDARTGWERADLGPAIRGEVLALPPRMLDRSDGAYLLYPGKLHWLSGEPEGLKSWLAQIAVADALADGLSAAYVDFEGDDLTIVGRLRALGVDDEAILTRLTYHRPEVPMSSETIARLLRDVDAMNPAISVIDGVNAAMGASNLDSNHSTDFHRWWTQFGHRLQRATSGPTIAIDHVVKNPENRGQYAAGTGQKLAAVDVHIGTIVVEPFGIGMTGRAKLVLHKDRPGALRPRAFGRQLGLLTLSSDAATRAVRFVIAPAAAEGSDPADLRPTGFMEKVSRALECLIAGKKRSELKTEIPGTTQYVLRAIDTLVAEGYIESTAEGKTHVLRSLKKYREAEDERNATPPLRGAGHGLAAGVGKATVRNRSAENRTDRAANRSTVRPLRENGHGSGSPNGSEAPPVPNGSEESRTDLCAACGDVYWLRKKTRWQCGSCGEWAAA